MEILIFKTDLKTEDRVKVIKPYFDENIAVKDWCVDLEDIDCVLRIEANNLKEFDIISMANSKGFYCEPLSD